MGFNDEVLNDRLLKRMPGNLDAVIEKLLQTSTRKKCLSENQPRNSLVSTGKNEHFRNKSKIERPTKAQEEQHENRAADPSLSSDRNITVHLDQPDLEDLTSRLPPEFDQIDDFDLDYGRLLSFLKRKKSGQDLINLICRRCVHPVFLPQNPPPFYSPSWPHSSRMRSWQSQRTHRGHPRRRR